MLSRFDDTKHASVFAVAPEAPTSEMQQEHTC